MNRRYDFDWLRVFGAVMVVVAHSAILFSTWSLPFGNIQRNKLFSELLWNLSPWLMPLFMLLAGATARFTLHERSNHHFILGRLLHLGPPILFFVPTFALPAAYLMRTSAGDFGGSLPEFYLRFLEFFPSNTFHLWFLVYLLIYAVITLPLFRFLETRWGRRLIDGLARACQFNLGIFIFALPLLAMQLGLSGLSPVPTLAVPPNDWARFVLLLLVYISGYVLVSDVRFEEAIARQWPYALSIAVVMSVLMSGIAWADDFDPYRDIPLDYSAGYITFWGMFAFSTWSWLVVLLGIGQRYLARNHRVLEYAAPASYPLYLLHPIIQYPALLLVAGWPVNAFVGFATLAVLVLTGTLLLTSLLRRSGLMRVLVGYKSSQLSGGTPSPSPVGAAGSCVEATAQLVRNGANGQEKRESARNGAK